MSEERKIKILCAEDEQDIRESIAEILCDEGFEVFEAENGKAAFESFMKNKPDLVISDIMMPELDGYGLLQLIRESKNIRNNTVPFIFLSALGQKENIIKGVNLSANDYLIKPIDFDLMIAKVREKTANAFKIQEAHDKNINNIKNQFSAALPAEVFAYLDVISQVSSLLRQQPYGPMPHRRYIEDIDRIYTNAIKMKAAVTNSLDSSVIDQKLNADEEIIAIVDFFDEFISSLSDKFKNRIKFEHNFESGSMPRVKIDRLILLDALRKIFAGLFKCDSEASIEIVIMMDHLDQMVLIFYLKSQQKSDLRANLDEAQVGKILDKQNCRFEIIDGKETSVILVIPSYRMV